MNIDLNAISPTHPARAENMSERAYIATHMLAAIVYGRVAAGYSISFTNVEQDTPAIKRAVAMADALLVELAQ